MIPTDTPAAPLTYTSSNLLKHTSANPLQRWLLGRFHRSVGALLRQAGATTPAMSLLDAGCGEGFAMREVFGRAGDAVVGIDGSTEALRCARQFASRRPLATADLLALPFASHSFDAVICMEVLEHLPDPHSGLAELCRVSRGWLLLSVPNEPLFRGANFLRGKHMHAWGNDPGHINHWSAGAFRRFIAQQCQVVQLRRSFPWTVALCRVG